MNKICKIGIIGCGNISQAYFNGAKAFDNIEIKACADLNPDAAGKQAEENGVLALRIDELLADPEIEIVVNLTIPQAHAAVNLQVLNAGKHVHCEKPFAVTREEGKAVLALAAEKGLMTGSAPDTFLGGGFQTSRKLLEDGWIGRPVSGTAFMRCHGHESWHPNPGFYYLQGGGPLFDMGPYYLTALVHLLGPVKKVIAMGGRAFAERVATSPSAKGQILPVEVDTHVTGVLEFCNGALITLIMSFDVWKGEGSPVEIHGTEGSMKLPDPNGFAGPVSLFRYGMKDWQEMPLSHGYTDSLRIMGVADMANAIRSGRPNRCSGQMGYHVLDVMHALGDSSRSGREVEIESTCSQPAPLPLNLPVGQLD
jgi:predicted dehydrogenase